MIETEFKKIQCLIITGLAKTGTTLPLALLDNHPDLLVFPEELRFFHLGCDRKNGIDAADVFLSNSNIQNLSKKKEYYKPDNYMAHGGTGFGTRDYSRFDFETFEKSVRNTFKNHNDPSDRFYGIIKAFNDALGGKPIGEKTTFVCKAPHNELYIKKWKRILGTNGRYIITTRLPIEHYLSIKNVDKMRGARKVLSAYKYVNMVNGRLKLWRHFSESETKIIDYDELVNNTNNVMLDVCDILGIKFNKSILNPTKMGVPWAGNSSRNIVQEKVYKNEHKAHTLLNSEEIEAVEFGLHKFYEQRNWPKTTTIGFLPKVKFKYLFFASKINALIIRMVLIIIPESTILQIKSKLNR